jgi:hypothetical protein
MRRVDVEFDDPDRSGGQAKDVAGTPEGDGDFETDDLASTGETSSGGQVASNQDTRDGFKGRAPTGERGGLSQLIDEVSSGKIRP